MPSAFARSLDMTSVADAPSESCDELPAVTLPCPLVVSKTGGSFAGLRASCRGGCTRRDRRVASSSPIFSPVFLSRTARVTCIGASSPSKNPSCCARAVRCWLTSAYSSCASPADAVALGDDFGRLAHRHVERRDGAPATHGIRRVVALHHRDRLDAAADRRPRRLRASPCAPPARSPAGRSCRSGSRSRRPSSPAARRAAPRRARCCGPARRAAGRSRGSLLRFRAASSAGALPSTCADAVRGQVVGPRHVERSAMRLGQRRARAGDDDGFSHGLDHCNSTSKPRRDEGHEEGEGLPTILVHIVS